MEFIKNNWTHDDLCKFNAYLKSLKNKNKQDWTKKIYNTNKKCLAIKIPNLRIIANQILKGNFIEFLDLNKNNNYIEQNLINGILISCIKDTKLIKKYLFNYARRADSWVETDIIKIKINKNNINEIFELAKELINDANPFVVRQGIILFFNYINYQNYLNNIFLLLNNLNKCDNYYVNMAISWLLCECFIKQKQKTLLFVQNTKLNKFVFNKFVSKCQDSFRICKQDKQMLKNLKNGLNS